MEQNNIKKIVDENKNLQPGVFSNWKSNSDFTKWIFNIDPRAKFSDGSKLTAQDAKDTWEAMANPDSRNGRIVGYIGNVKGFDAARKKQTSVIIANKNIKIAKSIGRKISTKYYLTEYSKDVVGVEVCSAIKNIYSMIIGAGQSLNSSSNLFQKAILEMRYLNKYFKGKDETILGLAGVGDLYVSAAGGRNSKMGSFLGKGFTFKTAKKRFMPKETVEGEELAREIAPFILRKIDKKKIPLMVNLLKTIKENKKLKIKV